MACVENLVLIKKQQKLESKTYYSGSLGWLVERLVGRVNESLNSLSSVRMATTAFYTFKLKSKPIVGFNGIYCVNIYRSVKEMVCNFFFMFSSLFFYASNKSCNRMKMELVRGIFFSFCICLRIKNFSFKNLFKVFFFISFPKL